VLAQRPRNLKRIGEVGIDQLIGQIDEANHWISSVLGSRRICGCSERQITTRAAAASAGSGAPEHQLAIIIRPERQRLNLRAIGDVEFDLLITFEHVHVCAIHHDCAVAGQ
jgi:hypothetical protein